MVKIRLMRMGAKKRPFYRVVVADSRSPRDGRFIENIGKYHPLSHPSVIEIDSDRAIHWLGHGAQPSQAVQNLLVKTGIWSKFTGGPGTPVPPPPDEAPKGQAAATAEAPAEAATEAPAEEAAAPAAETEDVPATEESPAETPAEESVAEEGAAAEAEPESAPEPEPAPEAAPAEETEES
jgi:small subunit ribosomal protein S16